MARHKCIVCFGQSNMDGNALLTDTAPGVTNRWVGVSLPLTNDVNYRVQGINYWMADLNRSAPDDITNYAGKFVPQQFYYSTNANFSLGTTPGYQYSSTMTTPKQNPVDYNPQRFGPDIELAWNIQHELKADEELFVIKLGIGSTYLSKYIHAIGGTSIHWFQYDDKNTTGTLVVGQNDWHPGSTVEFGNPPEPVDNTRFDLFGILCDIIFVQAEAWIHANKSPNDDLDVIGIFMKLGESDALEQARSNLALQNTRAIRDEMRKRIVLRNMTSRKAENIPFIIAGVDTVTWPFGTTVNAAFQQLADDDQWTGYFDTTGYPTNTGDIVHVNAAGMITMGQTFYTTWKSVVGREADATRDPVDLPTLSSIRTLVKRRYERNTVGNELQDFNVNALINDSIREILNTLGDDCWFMRQIAPLTVSGVYPGTFNLPRAIKRLIRVESTVEPGRAVIWRGLGYTDEGRLQVTLQDFTGGPYVAHFIIKPKDLSADADTTIIPQDYVELVVMLACKRLAESAGNASMSQYYQGEVERIWKRVKQDVQRYDRMRQEALSTNDTWDTWRNAGFPDPLWYL